MSLTTPIALIFFNRPDTLAEVFARVRAARPRHLFLIADGPRPHKAGEAALCAAARAVVADDRIDWPCEVVRDFSDTNLGCRDRIVSGLTRLFEVHEEAIILEDDCLPDPTFFPYASELLERYRDDPEVAFISGTRYSGISPAPADASYQFCTHPSIWGWAAWRRTWEGYDPVITSWGTHSGQQLDALTEMLEAKGQPWNRRLRRMVGHQFDRVHRQELSTWDYQLVHLLLAKRGKCVMPATNLITNLGFNGSGTHTLAAPPQADPVAIPLAFPLKHPVTTRVDVIFDQQLARRSWLGQDLSKPEPPHDASLDDIDPVMLARAGYHCHLRLRQAAGGWIHALAHRSFKRKLGRHGALPGEPPALDQPVETVLAAYYAMRLAAARRRSRLWFLNPATLLLRALKHDMRRRAATPARP